MLRSMVTITCIIALLALAFAADSATIRVDWSGGGDYTSIQPDRPRTL